MSCILLHAQPPSRVVLALHRKKALWTIFGLDTLGGEGSQPNLPPSPPPPPSNPRPLPPFLVLLWPPPRFTCGFASLAPFFQDRTRELRALYEREEAERLGTEVGVTEPVGVDPADIEHAELDLDKKYADGLQGPWRCALTRPSLCTSFVPPYTACVPRVRVYADDPCGPLMQHYIPPMSGVRAWMCPYVCAWSCASCVPCV